MSDPFERRHPPPLPEAAPDADLWTRLLWPWLSLAERCPRHAHTVAQALAPRVDARDRTVSVERAPAGMTAYNFRRGVRVLVDAGLLHAVTPDRYRVTLPEIEHVARGEVDG